jgi:signal transduction histidine kinase
VEAGRATETGRPLDAPVDGGVAAAVAAGVAEVRYRNGLVIAWLRVALRSATLALYLGSLLAGGGSYFLVPVLINVGHLAVAAAVVALLRRRLAVGRVLLAAAAVDVAVVLVAGVRATSGAEPPGEVGLSVGYLLAVMELMLLLAAMTLPRRQVVPLAVVAIAFQGWLGLRAGLPGSFVTLSVLTGAFFGAAAVWAGGRMVELGARLAVDAHAAALLRRHRDELAAANAAIAAQRDEVVAAHQGAVTLTRITVHDLRNPLTAFMQIVALARARLEGRAGLKDVVDELDVAAQEGQRLADMVGDLLLVFRGEAQALRPSIQPVMVLDLLRVAARAMEARAADRGVALTLACDPDLAWPLDLDLVRRLVDNLVSNALRFVRRGDRLELAAGPSGDALALQVRNSGPPVPPEVRAHLFEKHAPGRSREWHHAGLGLYLCRLVAEAHGGTMALVDDPAWPVVFEARFPAARAAGG